MMRRINHIGIAIAIFVVSWFFVLLAQSVSSEPKPAHKTSETVTVPHKPLPKVTIEGLLEAHNKERAKVGVAPLVLDDRLNKSAQFKAEHMQANSYLAHEDPATGRKNGLDLANSLTPECAVNSENIVKAGIKSTLFTAMFSWMTSKDGHREAILDPRYDKVGFGISENYTAAHFCDLP